MFRARNIVQNILLCKANADEKYLPLIAPHEKVLFSLFLTDDGKKPVSHRFGNAF
jgi:hypothetical protein